MRHYGVKVRLRDWLWAVAALVALVGTVRLVITMLGDVAAGGWPLVGFTVAMLLGCFWLVAGAWRRTVWGAPPGGQRDQVELRRVDRERVDRERGSRSDPV